MKLEVKVRFQVLNPHPAFQFAKKKHKTIPSQFIVTYLDFNREPAV